MRALTPEHLRAVGLSKQKAQYVHNVAEWFAANRKLAKQLPDLPDDAVIAALTGISGIGIWTANVFLMFTLGRADVVPVTDLGIQNGVQLIYRLKPNIRRRWSRRIAAVAAISQHRLPVLMAGRDAQNNGRRSEGVSERTDVRIDAR